MAKVVTFGEIMLRLSPQGWLRFAQADVLEATFGGAEANVAAALAALGVEASYVTLLPDNDIGQAAINYVRRFGPDTSMIVRQGPRVGIYFLENGAMQRGSKVVYDRAGSSIAEAKAGDVDWEKTLAGASWFHTTGITPAISQGAADLAVEGAKIAKQMGLTVSCDLNYRKKLWLYGKTPAEVMPELVQYVDVAIGNEEDCDKVFGVKAPAADVEGGKVDPQDYRVVCEQMVAKFPNLKSMIVTLRGSISASHNTWSGVLYEGGEFYVGPKYDITHIVDRVGGGDSFAAGFIYSKISGKSAQDALNFAVTASCLKHSIRGDFNLTTADEVEKLLASGGGGRVQR